MKTRTKPKLYSNHTSVSLKMRHREILQNAAEENDISMNDLMVLLLRYINERSFTIIEKRPRVKYQLPEGNIQIVNLYINQRDYERNLDARRFAKVSVSWLLAYAIDHYLDIIIQKINKNIIKKPKILNNYVGLQTFSVKKFPNRIKMTSIWYPQKE